MNERVEIGQRLLEERKRLQLPQNAFGVAAQVQRRYEIGESTPGADYLAHFAAEGGDVLYVVEGKRAVGMVSDDEAKMLSAWRTASEPVRRAALAALLSDKTENKTDS